MADKVYQKIIDLISIASNLAKSLGIDNLLQPLVKEMIIADILVHRLTHSKHDSDACSKTDENEKYEYLTCKEGGLGQLDRIFKSPEDKRNKSLHRITRNSKIYFAIFYKQNQVKCKVIYEVEAEILLTETLRKLDRSKNNISHVGFSEKWARKNGKIVFEDKDSLGNLN